MAKELFQYHKTKGDFFACTLFELSKHCYMIRFFYVLKDNITKKKLYILQGMRLLIAQMFSREITIFLQDRSGFLL